MCLFPTPKQDAPVLPPEYAQAKSPDEIVAKNAGKLEADRAKAAASTVLTSGSGVTTTAPTQAKTLLGQ